MTTRIHDDVKGDMRRRDPDWWRPEEDKYWSLYRESARQREEIERIVDKQVGVIVDAGGGQGRMLSLAYKADRMILLDISHRMVKKSKDNAEGRGIENAHFVVGDAENMPIKSASADVVICLQTLVHIPNRERCIEDLSRVVKDNGSLIIDIPLYTSAGDFLFWSLRHGGIKNLLADFRRGIGLSKSYSSLMTRKDFYDVCGRSKLSMVKRFSTGPWTTFVLTRSSPSLG